VTFKGHITFLARSSLKHSIE